MKLRQKSTPPLSLLLGFIIAVLLSSGFSCNRQNTGLTGVLAKPKWKGINPKGYAYIPSGTLQLGPRDDAHDTFISRPRQISIQGFFMSDHEVTNREYREFVHWARDSVAHTILGHYRTDEEGKQWIDWKQKIDWSNNTLVEQLYTENEGTGKSELDISKLVFEYEWYDWREAALNRSTAPKNSFIRRTAVNVYPVISTGTADSLSFPEDYFTNPLYDDYPVAGVSYYQAMSYCYWKTQEWERAYGGDSVEAFRLPTEMEWEYAALGGMDSDSIVYPWGKAYFSPKSGKKRTGRTFYCNGGAFKEAGMDEAVDAAADGYAFTAPVRSYSPNPFGLYQMGGNVAEWTSSLVLPPNSSFLKLDGRLNVEKDSSIQQEPLYVMGGSWADAPGQMAIFNRKAVAPGTASPYIGFRPVLTFLGRSVNDF